MSKCLEIGGHRSGAGHRLGLPRRPLLLQSMAEEGPELPQGILGKILLGPRCPQQPRSSLCLRNGSVPSVPTFYQARGS